MISIIVSSYKSDRYLDQFGRDLKIFAQDLMGKNFSFEVIIIANDPTVREKQFEKEFSGLPWFSFVPVGRESVFSTWNRGVSLAKGEKIGFWNVDDVRFPQGLIEADQLFRAGAELVYFPFKIARFLKIFGHYFLVHKQIINRQIPEFNKISKKEFLSSMLCGPFFVFTKSLYQKVGPFDEQFKIAGDFDWCTRAANRTDKFVKAKSIGGVFRVDGGGLSAGVNPRRVAENNIVYMRNKALEKITVAEDALMKEYRPDYLLAGGKLVDLNHYH